MLILYIVGCLEGQSKRYRVYNLMEALRKNGVRSEWKYEISDELKDDDYIEQFDMIVLFRTAYSKEIKHLINKGKAFDIPVVFDIDDLLFDEEVYTSVRAIEDWDINRKLNYLSDIKRYKRTMLESNFVTSSTDYICKFSRQYNKKSYVIPNGINYKQVKIARKLSEIKRMPILDKEKIIIGYLSGTSTHQKDFEQTVVSLKKIFNEYPNVYLKIVGHLSVKEYFRGYEDRIIKIDLMNWKKLVPATKTLDINLAPLEIDNPFCHAKSELKYFEAALVGVPTIASATATYSKCIVHGKNGMLSYCSQDWYSNIKALIEDDRLYKTIVHNSSEHVKNTYYPDKIGKLTLSTYRKIIEEYNKIKRLKIGWIIPEPFEASGGHRNIFRTIKYLSQFGHHLTLYSANSTNRFKTDMELKDFIDKHYFSISADVVLGTDRIKEQDVLFATHWTTAYILKENEEKAPVKCYFIQDYEPYFFQMGYEYLLAYNTYKMGFHPITSGPWCANLIKSKFKVEADYFMFPIDRSVYYYREEEDIKWYNDLKIVFFARPNMPRRCYQLGVDALRLVKKRNPNVEIVFYGDKKEAYKSVPFEFTNLGILPSINDLGALYRSADIGIAFSTTNPSLVPYEMMACGCAVVDIEFNNNEDKYGSKDNVCLAEANPQAIAEAIHELIEDHDRREEIIDNAIDYASYFPNEEEMVRLIEGFILNKVLEDE